MSRWQTREEQIRFWTEHGPRLVAHLEQSDYPTELLENLIGDADRCMEAPAATDNPNPHVDVFFDLCLGPMAIRAAELLDRRKKEQTTLLGA